MWDYFNFWNLLRFNYPNWVSLTKCLFRNYTVQLGFYYQKEIMRLWRDSNPQTSSSEAMRSIQLSYRGNLFLYQLNCFAVLILWQLAHLTSHFFISAFTSTSFLSLPWEILNNFSAVWSNSNTIGLFSPQSTQLWFKR